MKEIQNIKNERLVCLDFDDCIIEYCTLKKEGNSIVLESKLNDYKTILEKLKENVSLIQKLCNKHNLNVFIISSWAPLINDDLTSSHLDPIQTKIWKIIKTLPIIGKNPFRDRILAMEVLIDNNNKIVCIDDWDLEEHFRWAGNNFIMINIFNGVGKEKLEKLIEKEKLF